MHRPCLSKTKICLNFQAGKCEQGESCRYAHSVDELRSTPIFFKTTLCDSWLTTGSCLMGEHCRYAHGPEELSSYSDELDAMQALREEENAGRVQQSPIKPKHVIWVDKSAQDQTKLHNTIHPGHQHWNQQGFGPTQETSVRGTAFDGTTLDSRPRIPCRRQSQTVPCRRQYSSPQAFACQKHSHVAANIPLPTKLISRLPDTSDLHCGVGSNENALRDNVMQHVCFKLERSLYKPQEPEPGADEQQSSCQRLAKILEALSDDFHSANVLPEAESASDDTSTAASVSILADAVSDNPEQARKEASMHQAFDDVDVSAEDEVGNLASVVALEMFLQSAVC